MESKVRKKNEVKSKKKMIKMKKQKNGGYNHMQI